MTGTIHLICVAADPGENVWQRLTGIFREEQQVVKLVVKTVQWGIHERRQCGFSPGTLSALKSATDHLINKNYYGILRFIHQKSQDADGEEDKGQKAI